MFEGGPNGMFAMIGYYIPRFTAERDPTLVHYVGLRGEKNRRKLASSFKTPISWIQYCALSEDNCTPDDAIAKRFPVDDESDRYFVKDLYTGHFHIAEANNCSDINQNCTGHFVEGPCTWISHGESIFYWNGIHLESRGNVTNNHGYSYSQILDIWSAANATKENVMTYLWVPESVFSKYVGTDSEFVRVTLPQATETCLELQSTLDTCSVHKVQRVGTTAANCDYPVNRPRKWISRGLRNLTDIIPEASRSPALSFLQKLEIPPYAMDDIFNYMIEYPSGNYGHDMRQATCKWVYDNRKLFATAIPRGYPRILVHNKIVFLSYFAYVSAALTLLLTLGTAWLSYRWKKQQIMKHAQIDFIAWMLIGLFLRMCGSIISLVDPSSISCPLVEWSNLLGYTTEIVPILVKVAVINKVTSSGRKCRRVVIDKKKMLRAPILFIVPVAIYLVLWTALDIPTPNDVEVLDSTGIGNKVNRFITCTSASNMWSTISFAIQSILLFCATVLTWQSHSVIKELNESHWLAFLIYSHFLFMVLQLSVHYLTIQKISPNLFFPLRGILLSLDTSAAIIIYFGPKFFHIVWPNKKARQKSFLSTRRRASSLMRRLSKANEIVTVLSGNEFETQATIPVTQSQTTDNVLPITQKTDDILSVMQTELPSTGSSSESLSKQQQLGAIIDTTPLDPFPKLGRLEGKTSFSPCSSESLPITQKTGDILSVMQTEVHSTGSSESLSKQQQLGSIPNLGRLEGETSFSPCSSESLPITQKTGNILSVMQTEVHSTGSSESLSKQQQLGDIIDTTPLDPFPNLGSLEGKQVLVRVVVRV